MSVESAIPGRGGMRATNVAQNGSGVERPSGSGLCPLIRSSSRERKRVSRKKNPSAPPGTRSPLDEEMMKEEPSTRVTRSAGEPSPTPSPVNVQAEATPATLPSAKRVSAFTRRTSREATAVAAASPRILPRRARYFPLPP